MKYFYSISTQGFYLDNGMLDAYKAAGSLPADLHEIMRGRLSGVF